MALRKSVSTGMRCWTGKLTWNTTESDIVRCSRMDCSELGNMAEEQLASHFM